MQICRLRGFSPIVAVVGGPHKVAAARALGADVVIDKTTGGLWRAVEAASPSGYAAIFDANGVETLQVRGASRAHPIPCNHTLRLYQESFKHLAATGHLVCYGFHSNVPKGAAWLSPAAWVTMALGMSRLPHFNPLELVTTSRSVSGFNLSFFADEHELTATCVERGPERPRPCTRPQRVPPLPHPQVL